MIRTGRVFWEHEPDLDHATFIYSLNKRTEQEKYPRNGNLR